MKDNMNEAILNAELYRIFRNVPNGTKLEVSVLNSQGINFCDIFYKNSNVCIIIEGKSGTSQQTLLGLNQIYEKYTNLGNGSAIVVYLVVDVIKSKDPKTAMIMQINYSNTSDTSAHYLAVINSDKTFILFEKCYDK